MLKLGLETESLHLWFQNKRMDIFGFIEKAHEMGFDGVQINVVPDYNLDPVWGALGGNSDEHLKKVKELIDKYNLYVEIDTRNLEYDHLVEVIKVADKLGAEIIRSYIPIKPLKAEAMSGEDGAYDFAKVRCDFDPNSFDEGIEKIKKLIPVLQKYRIKLALENHEYETSEELVDVVKKLNSKWVGLHYDFGNSMMVWEEPIKAAENMAPYTLTTHFKDHIIIEDPSDKYGYVVCGVPAGEGNIDLEKTFAIMMEKSSLTRINVEMCYPYCAQFKRTPGTGGVEKVGEGAFKVEKSLYDYNVMRPRQYYYPQEVSNELLEELLKKQMEGVEKSFKYLKNLRDNYFGK
ncbi:sugar phosphate isomerase/epimerase family protein [Fusobacterium perfoetens]|uniref:sugar phosphate isomerase/epimerase family protein n=1 Tax=Fusobacterium perfoetens TaxID=852 RepID=UPI000480E65D|nr:sugar phosphate isomerase/epimerase family protein [Fusobacterium perfoetens]